MRRLLYWMLFALWSGTALAAEPPIFSSGSGAIRGYDPVAYFTAGRPTKGREAYTTRYMDADWYFTSAENRDLFVAMPEKYAPQYGGYCAWAVANGYTATTDPWAWAVVDGRLYLNYSQGVQRKWRQDIPGNIARADANWPQVLEQ